METELMNKVPALPGFCPQEDSSRGSDEGTLLQKMDRQIRSMSAHYLLDFSLRIGFTLGGIVCRAAVCNLFNGLTATFIKYSCGGMQFVTCLAPDLLPANPHASGPLISQNSPCFILLT